MTSTFCGVVKLLRRMRDPVITMLPGAIGCPWAFVGALAERSDQIAKPRFVVAPFTETRTVDRLTHLFRAWCVYWPLRFIKAQASLIERNANIFEQPADLPLKILNEIVVDDAMHPSRQ